MLLKTESQRFWEKVKKTRTCWLWLGKPNESGYGQFYATSIKGEGNKNGKGKRIYAHRYSYLKAKGTIPKGKILDHHCETPSCVQPKHLAQVYVEKFGDESWELDALEPTVLARLVTDTVTKLIDLDAWQESKDKEQEYRDTLVMVSDKWEAVEEFVNA